VNSNPSSLCLFKIRFPDKVEIQANFGAFETPCALYNFLKENINPEITNWRLYTDVPKTELHQDSDISFLDLKFVPRCLVYFECLDGSITNSKQILKEQIFTKTSS